jgi:hypothetical protein
MSTMRSPAWLLGGMTRSVAGELALTQDRIVFEASDGRRIFDAPLGEITAVKFPWYYFGGGMKIRFGKDAYRVSFARPGNLPDDSDQSGDIGSARRSGAEWKTALTASIRNR